MSVLIKGIEMPKSCDECQLTTQYYDGGMDVCCPLDKYVLPSGSKRDDCPLVEVQPHGDLIDRDALIKAGWLNLHKEVIRMGGYAIYELPIKNPSIPVIIPAEDGDGNV